MQPPEFSVLVICDYGDGPKYWESLKSTLGALAQQTYSGTVEYLLVEHAETARKIPAEVLQQLPTLRAIAGPVQDSNALKNYGARQAQGRLLVILDSDCHPAPDWLEQIAAAWARYPDAAAISGRTVYGGSGIAERLLALLSRTFVDQGTAGATPFVSNNNASWRREVFLKHPLPESLGPFSGRMQSEAVIKDNGQLMFVPEIHVTHDFEGWPMEADIRKNCGFATVVTRLEDASMPYAGLIRMGRLAIPMIYTGKTLNVWRDVLRCWRHFRIRIYELPLALLLAPVVLAMEVPGMMAAYGDRQIGSTQYR
jgi:hypothetical protein